MTPTTKAQHGRLKKRAKEAGELRRKGHVPIVVPSALVADAKALGCKWDPEAKAWLGKPPLQEQLDAVAESAPDGETHSVITGDCPWCQRKDCFRIHNYRQTGSADWDEGAINRCDFCFSITSSALFQPAPRIEGEAPEWFLARCAVAIKERGAAIAAKRAADEPLMIEAGLDPNEVWDDPDKPGDYMILSEAGGKMFQTKVDRFRELLREAGLR